MPQTLTRIASFSVNHDLLEPGFYVSRIDGDITTYDLRFKKPNAGDYLSTVAMHTIEHLMATYLRNSTIKDAVIYFGPMGCQTGFYLLTRNLSDAIVVAETKKALNLVLQHEGKVPGASSVECGNYKSLELEPAQTECRFYLRVIEPLIHPMPYPA